MTSPTPHDAAFDAQARRYLLRVIRRWAPGLALLLVIALVIAYIPSRSDSGTTVDASSNGTRRSGSAGSTGDSADGSTDGTGSSAGTDQAGAAGSGAAGTGSAGGGGSGSNGSSSATGGDSAGRAEAAGLSRGGVTCGGSARQVPWSRYAPACVPAFTGSNGGATAPGVTKDTITVTYRISNSGESAAVSAAAGAAAGGTDDQYIADLQSYATLFNKQFETYGRKVVVKPFTGKGDWLQETQQQDGNGAQTDAATAHDDGAFADISVVSMTELYAEALANQKIVSYGAPYMSGSWFASHAPYGYSHWPDGDKGAQFLGNYACDRMVGLPATFAGDAATAKKQRVFGIIVPENPVYASNGDKAQKAIVSCGGKVATVYKYALDISKAAQTAATAMANMKANNVTTVLCLCDPISPIFLGPAANQQNYHPEWVTLWWSDAYGREADQTQWAHAMSTYGQSPKGTTTEAYRAFKLASPSSEPQEMYYNLPYWQMLMLFAGIQAAGPNLTAASMAHGYFAVPGSQQGGDFGPWTYGPGSFSPVSNFQVGYYDPNATSLYDGKKGAYENCDGGRFYGYNDIQAIQAAGVHVQPHCFGT